MVSFEGASKWGGWLPVVRSGLDNKKPPKHDRNEGRFGIAAGVNT
jgi:hypothetical protein